MGKKCHSTIQKKERGKKKDKEKVYLKKKQNKKHPKERKKENKSGVQWSYRTLIENM